MHNRRFDTRPSDKFILFFHTNIYCGKQFAQTYRYVYR